MWGFGIFGPHVFLVVQPYSAYFKSLPVTFSEFGLHENLVQTLAALGYLHPTPIQAKTIPPMLSGRDVFGNCANRDRQNRSLCPPYAPKDRPDVGQAASPGPGSTARELAIQVAESFERYASGMKGLRVATIYGGQDYQFSLAAERGVHVVVGTPGRLTDHLRRQTLSLAHITGIVLDEADEMLRMGFQEDVEQILGLIPAERQMALFSATMPDSIRQIASQYMREPAMIDIARRTATADTIRQRYLVSLPGRKSDSLIRVLGAGRDRWGARLRQDTHNLRPTCQRTARFRIPHSGTPRRSTTKTTRTHY